MYNKVILIGNLGKDPEVRKLEGGVSVGRFPVATNENYRDQSGEWQTKTEWHDVVVWRHLAERAEQTMTKGSLVFVEGKLTHRKWQDKDGNNRYTTEIVAQVLRKLERQERSLDNSFPGVGDIPMSSGYNNESSSVETEEVEDDLPF